MNLFAHLYFLEEVPRKGSVRMKGVPQGTRGQNEGHKLLKTSALSQWKFLTPLLWAKGNYWLDYAERLSRFGRQGAWCPKRLDGYEQTGG